MTPRNPNETRPGMPAAHLDRRSFLKGAAAVTAAAAVLPSVAEGEVPQRAVEWKRAPCRLCGVGCGLLIGVQGGRAVAVKGDPESPVSRGTACVKGYYAVQALYGRDRITRAMIRREGALAAATIGDALDVVAGRIRDAMQRHGPDSVALYGSAQWTAADALVAVRLFRGVIGTRHADTSARLYTASADAGFVSTFGRAAAPGGYDDIEQADVFVLWDVNLAETDPVLFSRILERRRTSPAVRIVDLATRTTRTSYAADRALLFAPHADLAIANGVCHELVTSRAVRRDFVDRYVAFRRGATGIGDGRSGEALLAEQPEAVSWEAFEKFLEDYAPERTERISGLAAADVRWLATLYADPARRVMTLWGASVNQRARGTWINNALHNIHLLVGKVATPGNAALPVSGAPGGTAILDDPFGHAPATVAPAPAAADAALGTDRPAGPRARPALALFRALERGEIRVLWIQAANPMVSLPHLSRFRNAARRGGAFVVVSEAYPTATTDVADVVLPAALWIERDGVFVNGERRIQHFGQLVRPPGDCLSDARQMLEVARRLGDTARLPWDPAALTAQTWEALRRDRAHASLALPAMDALQASAGVRWPAPAGQETAWRYNAAYDPAADRAHGAFDFYGHDDHRAWIWLRPYEPPPESPDRTYPFWFSTGRVVEHWGTGTLTRRIPTLHRAVPRGYVEVNRDDARRLGIRDGDTVRLTSRRGSVELEARLDYRSQPPRGRLFAPSFDEGAAVNFLTLDAACPISGQPDYSACAVRLERVGSRS